MLILIGSFLVLLVLGLPVALSMGVSSLLYIVVSGTAPDIILAQRMIAGVESFPLLAVPFFILAGNLMNIAGMSGTAIADAAGLGTIEIKAMKDHGYSTEFAVGVTAASATLGPIIPPSLPFVIYGMMANVSIGALFLAGLIPGVFMTLLMMLTVTYYAHKNKWGGDVKFSASRFGEAALE